MDVFPSVSSDTIATIVADMNSRGYGVAENCISTETLTELRRFIHDGVAASGGEYTVFTGAGATHGTLLQDLAYNANFQSICRELYALGTDRTPPPVSFYQVLRCLAGRTGEQHAYRFHYDSYVLTILLPILIPTDGQPGDLIMLPNTRPVRRTYFGNLVDKILLDNPVTQKLLRTGVLSGRVKSQKIRMTPGNVYFFWGCRSVHANEPCDQDKIRATALFHYVDPHAESWLRKTLLDLRKRKPQMSQPLTAPLPA